MSIFEKATRNKMRIPCAKGALNAEDLWDLPLTSRTGVDLDTLAIGVHRQLKAVAEESFVSPTANSSVRGSLELQLEVLKHIINVKLAENQAKADAQNRRVQRDQLQAALERKDAAVIDGLSADELRQRIAALGS